MANAFKDVIAKLERQRASIEKALSALREVDDTSEAVHQSPAFPAKSKHKGKRAISAEARERMAEAQRKRWATKRGADATKKAAGKGTAKKATVKSE